MFLSIKKKCLSLLLLTVTSLSAQNLVIDSLEKLVPIQKDTLLATTYNELTWQYRNVNRDKAIEYGNKAIQLATKLNYSKSIAQAYNDLGIIYFDKENYDTAIHLYEKAIEIRRKLKDDLGIAKLYNKIGIIYQKQGVFDKALKCQFESLTLFEKEKNDFGTSYALNNIGILNQNLGAFDKAIEYHKKSLAIKKKINDKLGAAGSLVNIGNIYFLNNEFNQAENNFIDGIIICRELKNEEYLSNALNNIGKLYIKTKKYSKAIDAVSESLVIRQKLEDSKGIASCYNNLGDIYTQQKKYSSADSSYTKGLSIAKKAVNCLPELNSLYLSYSNLLELQGNTAKAFEYYKLFSTTKDSLYTNNVTETFVQLETKYKTLQKEQQIQQQKFELVKKDFWLIGAVGFVLLASLVVYLLYRKNKHKQEVNLHQEIIHQQELATKAVLEAEENERKRIAVDLHDSIGQTMSAAKMNLSALQNEITSLTPSQQNALENVINLVDNSCKEVRNVSHNMMPNALLKNGLANAIREFISQIDNRILKVDLYIEGLNEKLENNIESILYRVIQECVNNVIKHSGGNHLDISLIKDNDGLSVTIEDNGKGFNTNNKTNFEGIGLKNIQSRIDFLKGTVEWQSQVNKGTLVAIHLPTN
ncbi:MAG: tetratricopeptide repeat protein [Chitinophagaceae bacterium]